MDPWNRWGVGMAFCGKVCGCEVSFPVTRVNPLWLMKLPGRGFMAVEFLLEDLSSGRKGEFRDSPSLHLLFLKCLQLTIINIPKWYIWGGMS